MSAARRVPGPLRAERAHEPFVAHNNEVFPMRERIRFRDNLGLGLRQLRQRETFGALRRGPWQVFIAIACHWQANAEAWPSQETIASFTGYTSRAVRDYVETLERVGIVRLRRERRPSGAQRIYYAPGLVTMIELAAFVERFPRGPVKARSHRPEAVSAGPSEASSPEHGDLDQIKPSSCEADLKAPPSTHRPEEEQARATRDDEAVARRALAERMTKKHPTHPPPRWFDAEEVAMVAACTAMLEGGPEAKMSAHRDAMANAFVASKEGPPTVRFIWQKPDHFLDHVERGRRLRLARERAGAPRPRTKAQPSRARLEAPKPIPDDVPIELEKLFGPGWRKGHLSAPVVREAQPGGPVDRGLA